MPVIFKEITSDNFHDCIRLKVRDDQKFVASNVYSIAQSKIEPKWLPRAIYHDETIVGFVMYELDYETNLLYLCRFMISENHQHKGYGKDALQVLKELAENDAKIEKIELSTTPEKAYGIKVYEKFGFEDTGMIDDGEKVFVLNIRKQ